MIHQTISEKAFLYSTWSGDLKIYEGSVVKTNKNGKLCEYHFISEKPRKSIGCHAEPDEIYNSVVWYPERNDEEAIALLIDYEETRIMELGEKIDNHRCKIKLLKTHLPDEEGEI